MRSIRVLLAVMLLVAAYAAASYARAADVEIDPALPDYRPAPGVSGSIKSVGSDTMNNLMTLWGEGFKKFYPSVGIEVEGKGTSTAPPALIQGRSSFGPMSRPMKAEEIQAFERKYGYKPTELPTSLDILAVYVHKDNPITGLSLPQVDAIFSRTRRLGMLEDVETWGQLGVGGDWAEAPISMYGRNSASGTYGYFKERALGQGDFKDSVKEQPGSSTVVQAIGRDRFAIGYSGMGYKTADVRFVPLARKEGGELIPATPENSYNGRYPLARPLILAVNYKPGSQLDPLRREFIRYIYSKQGQAEVVKDGYLPVTAGIAERALKMVGLELEKAE